MEIASFAKSRLPHVEMEIISIPGDYGLPLTKEGRERVLDAFLQDLSRSGPKGVGISCTAIAQAEEAIHLCERIKASDPEIFVFMGGYFPTIYYEEIFARTSAVDLIVMGEGEGPALQIVDALERGASPLQKDIPNLAWKKGGRIQRTKTGVRFDLKQKTDLNLDLLRYPRAYDILPYAFSRGCPYRCTFCLEEFIRPTRQKVPVDKVRRDLKHLSERTNARTLIVSDALFKSFDLIPFVNALGMEVNFETRSDVLDPSVIREARDGIGMLALGFESASYDSLIRMNKVRDRKHYEHYLANTTAIFHEAIQNEIPIMVFMIAGYPGDSEADLEQSLRFARNLSGKSGPGGHVFKIGECRVYPKTKIYDVARSSPDVVFDDRGVFGDNVVRQPSRNLEFATVLKYMKAIFELSNFTPKLREKLSHVMPLFRLPVEALKDRDLPDACFKDGERNVLDVQEESLVALRASLPGLAGKYRDLMSTERSARHLAL
jgi:hypothetical protein